MNELLSLLPVLFLVYLFQCIASAPNTGEVFFLGRRMRGQRLRHALQVGRSQNNVFIFNPFLPYVGAAFVHPPPFMIRRDRAGELLGIESLFCPARGGWRQSCSFDVPHKFTVEESRVILDGSPFFSVRSEEEARRLAAFLEKVGSAPSKRRSALLEKYYRNMFSIETIDKRLGEYSRGTEMLRITCFYLFVFMFLLAPSLVFFRGLHRLWPILLTYIVVSCWLILWLYRRSYRYLYPLNRGGSLPHMIGIALSPFAAIRANDSLVADLLAGFHPVAVARRTLPEKEFLEFAGLELRKMKYVTLDEVLLQFLTEFLALEQVDLGALLAPPVLESKLSRSFCPVCLTQYVIDTGLCQDCGNVALRSFLENNREPREPSNASLS